ncbi:MAG: 3-isopropylmalate dehydratase small subunit [Kiloniellaceae bacterium]
MEPFQTLTAVAAPLGQSNINTDQIFPARMIKKPRTVGYAQFTFHDLRRDDRGELRSDFSLNQTRYDKAGVLIAGINFGCGSSREGAVYTLLDSGFRVLIAPSFGDIFAANCLKNGLLTIVLPEAKVADLREAISTAPDPRLTIDLEAETITRASGETLAFLPEPFQKHCLLNGLNEIDLSLAFHKEIGAFEAAHRARLPWLAPRQR